MYLDMPGGLDLKTKHGAKWTPDLLLRVYKQMYALNRCEAFSITIGCTVEEVGGVTSMLEEEGLYDISTLVWHYNNKSIKDPPRRAKT